MKAIEQPTRTARKRRDSLLKVRVASSTKAKVAQAAAALDLDQSSLVRIALQEYISLHCPETLHAA